MSGYFDYSQYGEQKYILKALGIKPDTFTEHAHPVGCPCGHCDGKGSVVQTAFVSIKPMGRLLEIGAFDAFAMSNSRALIELGWSAVLFEPSPGPLRALVKEYGNNPKVEVVAAAVIVGGPNVLALRGMGADKSNARWAAGQATMRLPEGDFEEIFKLAVRTLRPLASRSASA